MGIFNYDKKLLTGIKSGNFMDIVDLIIDFILGVWFLNKLSEEGLEEHFVFTLILIGIILYFIYLIVKLACRFLITSNIEKEKLEITINGLNMTFHERVLISETLKYVEIPWSKVKSAEAINNGFSLKNLNLLNLFTYKEEYKTIQIYTSNGLFKLFIENNNEAAELINSYINPQYENHQTENTNNYEQKQESNTQNQPTHKWMCECGKIITSTPCSYCGKGKTEEKVPNGYWKCMGCGEIISIEIEKCKCGFKKKHL